MGSTDLRGNTTDEMQAFCAAGAVSVKDKTDYAGGMRFGYCSKRKDSFCIRNLGSRCAQSISPSMKQFFVLAAACVLLAGYGANPNETIRQLKTLLN